MQKVRTGGLIIVAFFFSGCGSQGVVVDEVVKKVEIDKTVYTEFENEFELPILLYHHIGTAPEGSSQDIRTWYVSIEKFEEDMNYLSEKGWKPLFMKDVLKYVEEGRLPEKSFVLSFDDGAKDFLTIAFPIIKNYNMKASVSIMTGVRGYDWLSNEDISTLQESGLVEFVSHTEYHEYLSRISSDFATDELEKSRAKLEEWTGESMEIIAYPFGLYNDEVIEIAKELGYKAGMTIKSGNGQFKDRLFEMNRHIITESSDIKNIF
ncbi:MAG: polysaccharide deacetylase family protein [Candidatus Magasanikbacteria bacterium]